MLGSISSPFSLYFFELLLKLVFFHFTLPGLPFILVLFFLLLVFHIFSYFFMVLLASVSFAGSTGNSFFTDIILVVT